MNILNDVPEDCLIKWTESAKYCYKIKCNCKKCVVMKYCPSLRPDKCRMKSVVIGLVRKYGAPKI